MQPTVSIVMSMRNAVGTIEQTIRSLQWQTLSDWELILFDDGSHDGCDRIVRSIKDSRIRVFCDGQSRGLAVRLNQAVAISSGRFIARMDADDICFPERLMKQVGFLNENPQVDLTACSAAVFLDDGVLVGRLPVALAHDAVIAHPFRGFPFPHPTWCGRAQWFRSNPYDPTLSKTQDQDLLLRSFDRTTFSGMADVLVGYRQDRLDIRKLVRGRLIFARSIWRYGRGSNAMILSGIGMQAMKGCFDLVMYGLGLNRLSQRQRLDPVSPALEERWSVLWLGLRAKSETTALACN